MHQMKTFRLDKYRVILETLAKHGKFIDPSSKSFTHDSFFLRHDIDLSLDNTEAMFIIEQDLGVPAHYYFRTNSPSYNINSVAFEELVTNLTNSNMCIGLHFERLNLKKSIEYEFMMQINFLENIIGREIIHFSPHDPGSLLNAKVNGIHAKYINAYSYIDTQKLGYLSDSNGIWSERFLIEFLESLGKKPYQILIHPEWWNYNSMHPLSKIVDVYTKNFLQNLNNYALYYTETPKFTENEITKFKDKIQKISKSLLERLD